MILFIFNTSIPGVQNYLLYHRSSISIIGHAGTPFQRSIIAAQTFLLLFCTLSFYSSSALFAKTIQQANTFSLCSRTLYYSYNLGVQLTHFLKSARILSRMYKYSTCNLLSCKHVSFLLLLFIIFFNY